MATIEYIEADDGNFVPIVVDIWRSSFDKGTPMTLEEAWSRSVSGVAVRGNTTMQDIIWPRDSPHPFAYISRGYKAVPDMADDWRKMEDWHPLHRAIGERDG